MTKKESETVLHVRGCRRFFVVVPRQGSRGTSTTASNSCWSYLGRYNCVLAFAISCVASYNYYFHLQVFGVFGTTSSFLKVVECTSHILRVMVAGCAVAYLTLIHVRRSFTGKSDGRKARDVSRCTHKATHTLKQKDKNMHKVTHTRTPTQIQKKYRQKG